MHRESTGATAVRAKTRFVLILFIGPNSPALTVFLDNSRGLFVPVIPSATQAAGITSIGCRRSALTELCTP